MTDGKTPWLGVLGLAWAAVVFMAYYLNNAAYYREKLGTFLPYFLG